ncbi:DUF1801 domain-containing protein [Streptomyces sp. NPDC057638]|uniref:DUF1801 domain-containing protein n=1 Tax=Streptomyces sp. NPDC057638 TaxID=3346190 RepID=UPI0036A91B27
MAANTTVDTYIAGIDEPLRAVAEEVRKIIDAALPGLEGAMWHGHPVWSAGAAPGKQPVALVKAYGTYVTFGLWRGQSVPDASGRLAAGAREMASVKLRSVDDIDGPLFQGWLERALALES